VNYFLCSASRNKQDKIALINNAPDKIRSLIGDLLIKFALEDSFFFKFDLNSLSYNMYGKPYLDTKKNNVHFNISHSGQYVICGVLNDPVGVDVEEVKFLNMKPIINNFFSQMEKRHLSNLNNDNIQKEFFKIWTKKES